MPSQDDAFPALHEMPCDRRADVPDTDDCGGHYFLLELLRGHPRRCASTSISRSTFLPTRNPPASTAMFQVIPQSSRSMVVFADAASIGFPSMSGPHPRNSPERVTGLVMSLIVRSPSSSNDVPPVGRTAVLLNASTGCFSISRKSPLIRCWSRFSVCVVILPVFTSTSRCESCGESPTSIVPVNSVNCPRTFESMCRATNPTTVWVGSSSYVPAGGIDTPPYSGPRTAACVISWLLTDATPFPRLPRPCMLASAHTLRRK